MEFLECFGKVPLGSLIQSWGHCDFFPDEDKQLEPSLPVGNWHLGGNDLYPVLGWMSSAGISGCSCMPWEEGPSLALA